ncbi:MAG: hypothetical protein AAFQ18_01000 [Pseudomonadota bacterium]
MRRSNLQRREARRIGHAPVDGVAPWLFGDTVAGLFRIGGQTSEAE